MTLGIKVGFGPCHTVLHGDPTIFPLPLPKRAQSPIFVPYLLWSNSSMDRHSLSTQVGLVAGHILLDGDPAPPPKMGALPHLQCFQPMSLVVKRLVGLRCHFVRR